jgi:tetratricopeptide (TPR) repeat protein
MTIRPIPLPLRTAARRIVPTLPTLSALAPLLLLGAAGAAAAVCPPYVKHNPGGDYHDAADREGLTVVETFHFTPAVASLTHGVSGSLGGDIGYTLEHFPNHPKALAALVRLGRRDKSVQPVGAKFTISCFFERALHFVPADATLRMQYGAYLLANGSDTLALEQLREAARLAPGNATTNYNLGLLYVKTGDYGNARQYAWRAYRLGFPLPGLKQQLQRAGQWREEEKAEQTEPGALPAVAPRS